MNESNVFQGKPVGQMNYRGQSVRYVANQLVVGLQRELAQDSDSRESVLSTLPLGSVLKADFDRLGIAIVDLPEGSNILEIARQLEQLDAVAFAEPNLLDSLS